MIDRSKTPTFAILFELGFDVAPFCRKCGGKVEDTLCIKCQVGNFEYKFRDTDGVWLSEEDAISRIENDGRAEKLFNEPRKNCASETIN